MQIEEGYLSQANQTYNFFAKYDKKPQYECLGMLQWATNAHMALYLEILTNEKMSVLDYAQ